MALFKPNPQDYYHTTKDGRPVKLLKKEIFTEFNEGMLDLGDIRQKSSTVDALSVCFDLEDFTAFCGKIDPQLTVPDFMSNFLAWIFESIRKGTLEKEYAEGYKLYADLPFFCKYMGDGVLFLWDTRKMVEDAILNVVASMYEICLDYRASFLPTISVEIPASPKKLRCGIARGNIYTIGNGEDFVGPSINMSARLQKFESLSFCFARRGLDPRFLHADLQSDFITKKVNVRGIGDEELICLLTEEYNQLDAGRKKKFKDP